MTQIASPHNPRLKAVRRLQNKRERERSGRFLAEGEDLIAAALMAKWPVVEGYRVAGSGLGGPDFTDVEEPALAAVSALGSGTRVIGVYEQRWATAPAGPLCVYLHGVGDPGNIGAVLRSAQAFGASSVVLGPDCADPYSPKAVRASMGAIFGVAVARVESITELPGERVALVAHAGEPLQGLSGPVTLVVGAEREGLPPDVVTACERVAHIPIEAESLNAAMAATVALYEMTRRGGRDHDTVTPA
ncbi:MAG TPA: RNA methyltransferase [Solirubrobacteraceae bacterium]|nr:RNA methyltransferase [Solirubrobacteraceae bacterium]